MTTPPGDALTPELGSPPQPQEASIAEEKLRHTYLFGELSPADLAVLARECAPLEVEAGSVVVRQGDNGDTMYLVVAGSLEVFQTKEDGQDVRLGEVRKGEHFGESALLEDVTRMASVRALVDCQLLSLSRTSLEAFFARKPQLRETLLLALESRIQWAKARQFRPSREQISQILTGATGASDPDILSVLEAEVEWVTLPRGDTLIREGEPGDAMFIVVSGRLLVHVGSGEQKSSIAELGPGETVGEMALLSSEPRSASASALRDTELLRLSKAGFNLLVTIHPRVMANFARTMVERLSRSIRTRNTIAQLRTRPLATPEDCAAVAATENLVLRNLKITQMYHQLSLEMTLLIGHQDTNWCTFACNASKTAGYSIRREELPFYEVIQSLRQRPRFAALARRAELSLSHNGFKERAEEMLEEVSRCISEGNLKVFVEIAPIFARFINTFHQGAEYDRARLEAFTKLLKPGPTMAGGQDLLAEAMSHYYDAMFETSVKRKSELILLANAKVGLHEQQRLQPNIVDGLNAPIRAGLGGLLVNVAVAPLRGRLPGRVTDAIEEVMQEREQMILERATALWRKAITRSMMTLRLPYGKVRIGRDMPKLPSEEIFPDVLQKLELPELVALVKKYDYTPDDLGGSGASDWGYLPDRMNFILDLFRSRQKSLELFDQPFLYEQRLEMAANRVPAGRL